MEDFDLKTFFQWSLQNQESSFFLDEKNDIEIKSFLQLKKDYAQKRSQALMPPIPLVIEKNERVIGFLRFTMHMGDERVAFISFAFINRDHLRDKSGEEAGGLILDYFFNRKNCSRVFTKAMEREKDYLDCLFRLGFKLEGTHRDQIFLKGSYLSLCTLGILREEKEQLAISN